MAVTTGVSERVERLREFWQGVSSFPFAPSLPPLANELNGARDALKVFWWLLLALGLPAAAAETTASTQRASAAMAGAFGPEPTSSAMRRTASASP